MACLAEVGTYRISRRHNPDIYKSTMLALTPCWHHPLFSLSSTYIKGLMLLRTVVKF